MNKHVRIYEQYCNVLQCNIVLEETVFYNGTKKIDCMHYPQCQNQGGCKNKMIGPRLGKKTSIIDCKPNV